MSVWGGMEGNRVIDVFFTLRALSLLRACIPWKTWMYNGKDTIFVGCSFCMSLRGYHNCKFFVRITIFMTRIVIPHVVLSLNTQHPRCLRIELIGLST